MKIIIVGGGIAGLSAAWFLHRKDPKIQISLFEKKERLGGWIQTAREGGFLFEKGPRTFQKGRSPFLLSLIEELGLEILSSDRAASKRFIFHKGRLRSVSSFLPGFLPSIIREFFIPPSKSEKDESIYDFALRRWNGKIGETLFDPMTLGIYAGDIRTLSLRSCFPSLYRWEREKGSVLAGLLSAPRKEKGLFTLKEGMGALIEALEKRIPMELFLNCPVERRGDNEVGSGGKKWRGDQVIWALPPELPSKSVWVVNLAYSEDVLLKKGFGYLVPTREKQTLLGVIFDSVIFPQQNRGGETRLTAILRGEEKEPLEAALNGLKTQIGIFKRPIYSSVLFAKEAIPQFEIGSSYPYGISVDACIQKGKALAELSLSGL